MDVSSIALFGPEVTDWTVESLATLQSVLVSDPNLSFLVRSLVQLPAVWRDLKSDGTLCFPTDETLQQLSDFAVGKPSLRPGHLTNAHYAPLTVISQTIELVRHAVDAASENLPLSLPSFDAVQGFCIGLLCATAMAASGNWAELERNMAASLRLAVAIGAVIDAEDMRHGPTDGGTAISARWRTDLERTYLEATLDAFPKAYVSCITDEKTVTITLSRADEDAFCAKLGKARIATGRNGLAGCFHHSRHAAAAAALRALCAAQSDFQLPRADKLRLPLRSTADAEPITGGRLHDVALDAILCRRAHWYQTVRATLSDLPGGSCHTVAFFAFGQDTVIPRSLALHGRRFKDIGIKDVGQPTGLTSDAGAQRPDEIAIIGMACRFPQADSVDEFWRLIASGKTAIGEVPLSRFNPAELVREPSLGTYWGNFLRSPDTFDHRFFNVSGREAKSMDPQQRLALQVAYEALESSGYYSLPPEQQVTNVGCYLGIGTVDYEQNVASENANAFSATGTLRAFASGRISHFFGWTGPSITMDTACSSSAVAIHTACKALLANECSMALAGGVNVMTNPNLFQNLAAASFLDPNGSSKAFDEAGKGYSRGEGAGLFVLKPLSKALADQDLVLGVIAGSAINQGSNTTPLTQSDPHSQSTLYKQVLSIAGIEPRDVTYVEAHGTGTLVGDPIEYESRMIPRQANFVTLNPRIRASPSDNITIPTQNTPWKSDNRVALVNNYGASGSIAALVLREHDHTASRNAQRNSSSLGESYPISHVLGGHDSLGNIAFHVARRQNPSFDFRSALVVSDLPSLVPALDAAIAGACSLAKKPASRPVVLCFGGQNGNYASLSKDLFDVSGLLQRYLYASAMSWIASGLEVDTLIGHSFGQLTAITVADALSLRDGLRLISGRAQLMRDSWSRDRGVMLSMEGERKDVDTLVSTINATDDFRVDVACYNGPRSFVVAGDTSSIDKVEKTCQSPGFAARIKTTRLLNNRAYHSHLTENILPDLAVLTSSITVRKPHIRVETCSPTGQPWQFTSEELVQHTRAPVYFSDAVQRVAERLPSAVWLEAGSASPIISMARRNLTPRLSSDDTLISLDLRGIGASSNLANAVAQLWMAGSKAQYWLLHRSQQHRYGTANPPPYQFEKAKHWIEYKPRTKLSVDGPMRLGTKETELVSLVKSEGSQTLFSVDTAHPVFTSAAQGHTVAGQSLCPASMYVELAARCATALLDGNTSKMLPQIEDLVMSAPLGLTLDIDVLVSFTKQATKGSYAFAVLSRPDTGHGETEHAKGFINLVPANDPVVVSRMKLLRRLVKSSRCKQIVASPQSTGLTGSMVYRTFRDVVEYAPYYHGVRSISGLDNEAVGLITVPTRRTVGMDYGICDPISLDNFLQVAGIHVNCLLERKPEEVFMCTAIEEIFFSARYMQDQSDARSWTVHTRYDAVSRNVISNDIFVFDPELNELVLSVMGATFRSVPFKAVARNLRRLNTLAIAPAVPSSSSLTEHDTEDPGYQSLTPRTPTLRPQQPASTPAATPSLGEAKSGQLSQKVRQMLSDIIEIPMPEIPPTARFVDLGIDSLLVTEVLGEIQKSFTVTISAAEFQECDDIPSLCRRIQSQDFQHGLVAAATSFSTEKAARGPFSVPTPESALVIEDLHKAAHVNLEHNVAMTSYACFAQVKNTYDKYASTTGFANFYTDVFPLQSDLVIRYVVEAFEKLGSNIQHLKDGSEVPAISFISKHQKLVLQMYKVLEDGGLTYQENGVTRRTSKAVPGAPSSKLLVAMLSRFPQHTAESKLLHSTAHQLSECLSGTADPIGILFGDAQARALLEDMYTNAPMFKAGTLLLAEYLSTVLERCSSAGRPMNVLELGAGTGGTTKKLLETLGSHSANADNLTYTFTDLSSSLVSAARRKFSKYPFMKYSVLNVEAEPDSGFLGEFDVIISTNCIHATSDLVLSASHIRQMLRPDGIVCLVEATRNLYWFDMVFGLLEGWWLATDGREHPLADEYRWERDLRAAGFNWVDWSDGPSHESDVLRVITASPFNVVPQNQAASLETQETVVFKQVDGVDLQADIYYPSYATGTQRLPVEVTLTDGPIVDARDALAWVRDVLPGMKRRRQDVLVNGDKVVAVGWSTGGTLAMSLAWTSIPKGVRPPDAILAFYCPTDYEDAFWMEPNIPSGSEKMAATYVSTELDEEIWKGISNRPITGHCVPPLSRAYGVTGGLTLNDPRTRLALYMNWRGKTLHVLLNGLNKQTREEPGNPTPAQIAAVSPLAHIRAGEYRTPTFIIHPRKDDLIPYQQSQRTVASLNAVGIETELRIVEGLPHLFDVHRGWEKNEVALNAVRDGYAFICKYVGLKLA
ncbi:ketoacyl-synt-domain-containing protein [Thozetella sp. PMI_491]|nr:ketoacyl-synt-domain-containing protein [Thozetella sp. PMI_491]